MLYNTITVELPESLDVPGNLGYWDGTDDVPALLRIVEIEGKPAIEFCYDPPITEAMALWLGPVFLAAARRMAELSGPAGIAP